MGTIIQTEAISIIGIELRTTNNHAFTDIPLHWQRFSQEAILDHIPKRVSDDLYGVYTNFEHAGENNEGVYSFIWEHK
jgi:predicted transcriptional regulator YdeE